MSGTSGRTVSRPGYDRLREKARGYLPGWSPRPGSGDTGGGGLDAILQVAGRFHDILDQAIARSVEKARLAHLGALGQSLRPPIAATGWIAFMLDPLGADGTAPAGSSLGANVPGVPGPVVFETLESIALAASPLVEVVAVDPDHDSRIALTGLIRTDLPSAADAAKSPVPIPRPTVSPTPHVLYLGHPSVLALTPSSRVEVHLVLEPELTGEPWARLTFELFDGTAWRPLQIDDDTTVGLVRSGSVKLSVGPFTSVETTVQGVRSHWLRLHPGRAGKTGPKIRRVEVSSIVEPAFWSLSATPKPEAIEGTRIKFTVFDEEEVDLVGNDGLPVLNITAVDQQADSTQGAVNSPAFPPMTLKPGEHPEIEIRDDVDAVFEIVATRTSDGAKVSLATLPLSLRPRTFLSVEARRKGLPLTKAYSDALPVDPLSTFAPFGENPRAGASFVFKQDEVFAVPGTVATLLFEVLPETEERSLGTASATQPKASTLPDNAAARTLRSADRALTRFLPWVWRGLRDHSFLAALFWIVAGLGMAIWRWPDQPRVEGGGLDEILSKIRDVSGWLGVSAVGPLQVSLSRLLGRISYGPDRDRGSSESGNGSGAGDDASKPAGNDSNLGRLEHIVAIEARTATGWTTLFRSNEKKFYALAVDKKGRQAISFEVPEIVESTWAGVSGRWMRLRLVAGGYAKINHVAGAKTGEVIDVLTPEPPRVHSPRLTYRRSTGPDAPSAVLSNNDDLWADLTPGLNQPGHSISPFTPPSDSSATLYLGFQGALPPGSLGLGVVIDGDGSGDISRRDLAWEYFDGSQWTTLEARDGTAGLSRTGIVRLTWPAVPEPPDAPFVAAEGAEVTFPGGLSILDRNGVPVTIASAYPPPIAALIRDADGFENIQIVGLTAKGLALAVPLSRPYKGGKVEPSRLARFGSPRTWLRARCVDPGSPPPTRLRSIHMNAVDVRQGETHTDDVLGSSEGEARRAFQLAAWPVLEGESIEVRELSGHRAEVEWQVLREEIIARKLDPHREFRLELDPATNKIVAVWIKWKGVPDLGLSGPHDRTYSLDASRGLVVFGDDRHGRIPPAGANSIVARSYRTGGGKSGNVSAGNLNQVLSSLSNIVAAGNPLATSGGADGESLDLGTKPDEATSGITRFLEDNPASAVSGGTGLAPSDLQSLARSASSQVISALALRDGPGRVRLVIVAQDDRPPALLSEADPYHLTLSEGLSRRVLTILMGRMPGWGAGRVRIEGATSLEIAVAARVQADATTAGQDLSNLRRSLEREIIAYLDPRTGGPTGAGWLRPGGATVSVSDLARRISGVEGVLRPLEIRLFVAGGPPLDRVALKPGVVAVPDRSSIRAEVDPFELGVHLL